MPQLIALKKLRYPSGPAGKEYNAGDEFTALSERDAKALTLVRAARATGGAAIPSPAAELPLGSKSTAAETPDAPAKRTYKRRDMTAED